MEIEILDSSGVVINTIIADADFANEFYPNGWRERVSPEPAPEQEPEPISQPITLDEAKAAKVVEIKAEAGRRITALDWRLQRATEEELLGIVGTKTKQAVLLERQAIREASTAAEADVMNLTTVEAVVNFSW